MQRVQAAGLALAPQVVDQAQAAFEAEIAVLATGRAARAPGPRPAAPSARPARSTVWL